MDKHKDHDYQKVSGSGTGFCDCGNQDTIVPSAFCDQHCGISKENLGLSERDSGRFRDEHSEPIQANLFELFFKFFGACFEPLLDWLTCPRFVFFLFRECSKLDSARQLNFAELEEPGPALRWIEALVLQEVDNLLASKAVVDLMAYDIVHEMFVVLERSPIEHSLGTDKEFLVFEEACLKSRQNPTSAEKDAESQQKKDGGQEGRASGQEVPPPNPEQNLIKNILELMNKNIGTQS